MKHGAVCTRALLSSMKITIPIGSRPWLEFLRDIAIEVKDTVAESLMLLMHVICLGERMEALRALEAVFKTVTKRITSVEDELASDSLSSSSSGSRRGRDLSLNVTSTVAHWLLWSPKRI